MNIRNFQPGDELAQVGIYNEAAAALPRFKAASVDEVRRRCKAADFDPLTRFYAVVDDQPVAYATFQINGRVSYPWCRAGHEAAILPLLEAVLAGMRGRGLPTAFAAYREDWKSVHGFFLANGFHKARDMVNFLFDLADTPTQGARRAGPVTPLKPEDLPALRRLTPGILRLSSDAELDAYFFKNPYFSADAVFVVRDRTDNQPHAAGILIVNPAYANPREIDSAMPCFRLGAFGTEGMTAKRINGMFSFITRPGEAAQLGLELLGYAGVRLQQTAVHSLAAQVPGDAAELLRFYQSHFRKQGSFPVFERTL